MRVLGKGSHLNGPTLKTFVKEHALAAPNSTVIIDLRECTGMDSTFMGTLAGLASRLEERNASLHVVNAAGRNSELLHGLGLDEVFPVHQNTAGWCSQTPECLPIDSQPCSRTERTEVCLEAHQALAAADCRNADRFRDVIELMREELDRAALAH